MVNQATILGRVGRMDIRSMPNGNKVTNLSIVTSKKYTKDGVKQEKSTWHNICLYSKLADIAEKYVSVGDLLFVQGEIENTKYTDKKGIEKTRSFITAHELKLMPNNRDKSAAKPENNFNANFPDNDEVPF